MQYGEPDHDNLYISKEDVRAALKTIATHAPAPAQLDSLYALVLVDRFLANPDLPAIQHSREFALYEIITQCIADALSSQRRQLRLSPSCLCANLAEYHQKIALDAQQNSTELLCWSMLYHCYVRVDLNIDFDQYSELSGFSLRSLRRYRAWAVDYLTDSLIRAEWEARIRQRTQRLFAQLPTMSETVRLFGRDNDLRTARLTITSNPSATILITGPPGIGKTAFTQELVRGYIAENQQVQLNHLVWVDCPVTVDQIYDELHTALPMGNHTITLREWMTVYNLAVIIDNAQDVLRNSVGFDQLLAFLDSALVCIVSDVFTPLSQADTHIILNELNETAASQLIAEVYHTKYAGRSRVTAEDIDTVRAIAGGNPLAILLTIHNIAVGDNQPDANVLDRLLEHAYSQLTVHEKRMWFAIALLPPLEIVESTILALWPQFLAPQHVSTLIHRHIVEVVSIHPRAYRLPNVARNYVTSLYSRSSECLTLVSELVETIQDHAAENPVTALAVVSHISGLGWLNVDNLMKRHWLSLFTGENIDLRNQSRWHALVKNTLSDGIASLDFEAQVTHGIVLRQLSHWKEAEGVFKRIIVDAGKAGDFHLQAQARAELGVILRYHGRYEEAITNVEQAGRIAHRYRDDRLANLAVLESAQLSIDQQDGYQALDYLASIPQSQRSLRHLVLEGEALLLNNELEACREKIRLVTMQSQDDRLVTGRLHDIMGRVYLALGDFEMARYRFSIAISCFSIAEEPFAWARCLSNLGASLLNQGLDREAKEKLQLAYRIQSRLGDTVGLLATQRNIDICADTNPIQRGKSAHSVSKSTSIDDTSEYPPAPTIQ